MIRLKPHDTFKINKVNRGPSQQQYLPRHSFYLFTFVVGLHSGLPDLPLAQYPVVRLARISLSRGGGEPVMLTGDWLWHPSKREGEELSERCMDEEVRW